MGDENALAFPTSLFIWSIFDFQACVTICLFVCFLAKKFINHIILFYTRRHSPCTPYSLLNQWKETQFALFRFFSFSFSFSIRLKCHFKFSISDFHWYSLATFLYLGSILIRRNRFHILYSLCISGFRWYFRKFFPFEVNKIEDLFFSVALKSSSHNNKYQVNKGVCRPHWIFPLDVNRECYKSVSFSIPWRQHLLLSGLVWLGHWCDFSMLQRDLRKKLFYLQCCGS